MATKGRWKTALAYGDDDSVVIRHFLSHALEDDPELESYREQPAP